MIPLLKLKNINILHGSKYRLKNITMSIKNGEKIALLGQSGSGKSTFLKVANGTLKPNTGLVEWKGRKLKSLNRKERSEIGTLWQDLRLVEELSVCQNVNAGALGRHNIFWALGNMLGAINNDKCHLCIKAAGLDPELMNINITKLSGGQQQRVAIARLIRQNAQIFLADEPLASLDPELVKELLLLILKQKKLPSISIPSTCIISLHRPELIKNFTRVIGLKKGRMLFDIPSNELNELKLNELYR